MNLSRRSALLGLTTAVCVGRSSLALADAATDKRFVVIILRGALDGMAAVVPYGDAELTALRGEIVPPAPNQPDGLLDLGGFFGLHPALVGLHDMYRTNEAQLVHAVAGCYRVRSHFEAQDYLESGADHRMTSGWLNRVVAAMPPATQPPGSDRPEHEGLAVGVSIPLLLRGPAPVSNWAPHGFSQPAPDLYATIAALNQADPITGPAIAEGLRARGFGAAILDGEQDPKERNAFPTLARSAGEMLRAPNGPRIAALEIGGWDTHTAQTNRLTAPLKQLDAGLVALKTALGPAWSQTVVLVMTEFGLYGPGERDKRHRSRHCYCCLCRRRCRCRGPGDGHLARPRRRSAVRESGPGTNNRPPSRGERHFGPASGPECRRTRKGLPGQRQRRGDARPDRLNTLDAVSRPS